VSLDRAQFLNGGVIVGAADETCHSGSAIPQSTHKGGE
jgi:hypothetical protein